MIDEIRKSKDNAEGGMSVDSEIEMQVIRQWESIEICNDFVFCKIMQDRELLAELIRLILLDLKVRSLDVQAQRSIEIGMEEGQGRDAERRDMIAGMLRKGKDPQSIAVFVTFHLNIFRRFKTVYSLPHKGL